MPPRTPATPAFPAPRPPGCPQDPARGCSSPFHPVRRYGLHSHFPRLKPRPEPATARKTLAICIPLAAAWTAAAQDSAPWTAEARFEIRLRRRQGRRSRRRTAFPASPSPAGPAEDFDHPRIAEGHPPRRPPAAAHSPAPGTPRSAARCAEAAAQRLARPPSGEPAVFMLRRQPPANLHARREARLKRRRIRPDVPMNPTVLPGSAAHILQARRAKCARARPVKASLSARVSVPRKNSITRDGVDPRERPGGPIPPLPQPQPPRHSLGCAPVRSLWI